MKTRYLLLCCCIFISSIICTYLVQFPSHASEQITKNKSATDKEKKDEGKEKKKKEPINENDYTPILIGALLENPSSYLDKQIKFRGRFSSFTTLALDYEKALRKSKDYISICLFRPDSKIPLAELKLAYPVEDAKEDQVIRELEEGDLLEIYGKVFSAALDEPWVDITSLKKIEGAPKDPDDKIEKSDNEDTTKDKDLKKSPKKKQEKEPKTKK